MKNLKNNDLIENKNSNTLEFLLCLMTLFVQLKSGQKIVWIILLFIFIYEIIEFIKSDKKIQLKKLIILNSLIITVLSMCRSKYLTGIEIQIEIYWLFFGIIMLLLTTLSKDKRLEIGDCVLNITLFIGILDLIGMFFNNDIFGLLNLPYGRGRLVGGFDGPNEIGNFMVLILTYSLATHFYRKKIKFIELKIIPLILCIIFSWSRSALLVLIIVLIFTVVISLKKAEKKRRNVLVIIYVLIILLTMFLAIEFIFPKFQYVRQTSSSRDYIIDSILNSDKKDLLLGTGIGSYSSVIGSVNTTPHSEYLFFLISGGIIGVILLLLFFCYLISNAKRKKMYPELYTLMFFFIVEMSFNNLIRGRISVFFWIIVYITFLYPPISAEINGE